MSRPRLARSVALALIVAGMVAGVVATGRFATGRFANEASAQQVTTVLPNQLSIRTNQTYYQVGAPIQWCWSVPGPGEVIVLDTNAAGQRTTITHQPDSGSGGCANGTVTPPSGRECLELQWTGSGQYQTRTTCFTVAGVSPPPPVHQTNIWTDSQKYFVGQQVHVCWSVPAPGNITVLLTEPNGQTLVLASGLDHGGQQCTTNVVATQAGSDCVTITWTFNPQVGGAGAGYTPETATDCYTVVGAYPPTKHCLPPWAPAQITPGCS